MVTPCAEALAILAAGDLAAFHGLPDGCTTADADAGLGDSGPDPDGFDELGGMPVQFREHPASPAAPFGSTSYSLDGMVVVVRIPEPSLASPITDLLGRRDAVLPSALAAGAEQLIWARRGLVAHVDVGTGRVAALFALAPTTALDFAAHWLARVQGGRRHHLTHGE